jgi:hypothetical protein
MSKQVPLVSKPAEQSGVDLQPFVEEAYVARWLAALHRSFVGPRDGCPRGEADGLHQVQLSACSWVS